MQSIHQTGRQSTSAYVVAIVGFSDVGKTTLLEQLIPRLCARGISVGALKHASHGFDADRPGKDSHRIYRSGASAVALVSKHQIATFQRREVGEVSLTEALDTLPAGLDLVLAEGFAWEPVPRFVLVRAGESPAPVHVEAGPLLGVVKVAPQAQDAGLPPVYEASVVEALVDQIEQRVMAQRRVSQPHNLVGMHKTRLPIPMDGVKEGIKWRQPM